MPLREPPRLLVEDPPGHAATRAQVIALFGPPEAVLPGDPGPVLLYRRRIELDYTPNRFPTAQFTETWFLIQLDQAGRIAGSETRPVYGSSGIPANW
jgi:hypothetical protein